KQLHKSFGSQTVLNGIDLQVRRGETLAVLGRSGTGKSVLLKLIIGLQKPDSGSIQVHGEEITELSLERLNEIRTKVGFLFQEGARVGIGPRHARSAWRQDCVRPSRPPSRGQHSDRRDLRGSEAQRRSVRVEVPARRVLGGLMSRAFRLGLFIVGTLAILVAGVFLIGDKQFLFSSTYPLKTTFKSVGGLNNGAEVRVGG